MPSTSGPILGVHLLESITLGMYSNPLHCIREYVQNAFDSIRNARRLGQLEPEEGRIDIRVDPGNARIVIEDNGTGMTPEEAVVKLVDIGASEKASTSVLAAGHAGFRGIGRLAGISYCRQLHFETSDGGHTTCRIKFNAEAINKLTRPCQKPVTIVDAINRNYKADDWKTEQESRFFRIILEGVKDEQLMNPDVVQQYLEMTAPVRYDSSQWRYGPKILSIARRANASESMDTIRLFILDSEIGTPREVFRPFKDCFSTRNAKGTNRRTVIVRKIKPLPSNGVGQGWWGWLAVHERKGALGDVPFKGLRIRMHNIAVGDESIIREFWKTKPLALWCFGEVHITGQGIVPNSQRNDFEPSIQRDQLYEKLKDEMKQLEREIRYESNQRSNSPRKAVQEAEKKVKKARKAADKGFASIDHRERILKELNTAKNKVEKIFGKSNLSLEDKEILESSGQNVQAMINEVKSIVRTEDKASLSHLDRKARKVVKKILAVVKDELKDDKLFEAIERRVNEELRPGKKKPRADVKANLAR